MTSEESLRTAGRYARVIPGDDAVMHHFIRAVTDGRGTYRYVFHLFSDNYLVLKIRKGDKPYKSVKLWRTGSMERTYDTWRTKIPVEPSADDIIDAYAEAVEAIFEVTAFIMEDVSND